MNNYFLPNYTIICEKCNLGEFFLVKGEHAKQRAKDHYRRNGWLVNKHFCLCPECKEQIYGANEESEAAKDQELASS